MAIGDALQFRWSTPIGAAGNEHAAGSPGYSLGKWVATTSVGNASLFNRFPVILGSERLNSNVDYQCVFRYNSHPYITLSATKLWVSNSVIGVADVAFAVDNIPPTVISSTVQQAAAIGSKDDAPLGVGAFSAPTTEGSALSLGTLAPGYVKAFWVRRTAIAASDRHDDWVTLTVRGQEMFAAEVA